MATIGEGTFSSCSSFSEILFFHTNPPSLGFNAFSSTYFPIYVPYESLNDYETATYWRSYQSRIYPMAYKSISGYETDNSKWTFIASPLVDNVSPTAIGNMIAETEFDLYQFNPLSVNGEWENYKFDTFNIFNGKGYLYANNKEVNLIFKGEFNEEETKAISLDYDSNAASVSWNLVGNPFPCHAYINKEYYVMNEDGNGVNPIAVQASTPVPPCTGIFVKAETEGETIVFTRAAQ